MRKLATIFWCRKLWIFLLVHSILQIQHIMWRDWPHPACGCYNVKVTVKHKQALDCCLVWLQRPHICIVNNSTLLQKVYFCQLWGTNAANAANVKIVIIVDSNILARFYFCSWSGFRRWCLKIWFFVKWGPTFLPDMQIPTLTERKASKSSSVPSFLHFLPSFTTASISLFKLMPCRGSSSVIFKYNENKSSQDLLAWSRRNSSCSRSLLVSGTGRSFGGRPRPVGVMKTVSIRHKFSSSENIIKSTDHEHMWAWERMD